MNQLLYIQERIRINAAALGRLEAELPRFPNTGGLLSNVLSLRKQQTRLQHEFAEAADEVGLDVLHYQMLEDQPTASALSRAIGAFQSALATMYESIRHGAKSRRVLSPDTVAATELRVAYSYPGSFGLAFLIPNERLLLPEFRTQLDKAAEVVLGLGKAVDNTAEIASVVRQFGRAPIAAVYDWAKANAVHGTGAMIQWKRGEDTRTEALIQAPEFAALYQTLERTGETETANLAPTGWLFGADVKSRRFHFITDDDTLDIRGNFTDAISESQEAHLPHRYRAKIVKTTETTYATEEEKISYFLEKLEPL